MYAVIETGGKQYRVQPGDIVQVEKLDADVGSAVKFSQVLFVSKPNSETSQVWLGKPYLNSANVDAEVVSQGRGEKLLIIKMKRRKQYRRTQGHRQYQTQLLITAVDNGTGEKLVLSADDKKTKLGKFHPRLKPKGPARSTPLVGSRVRRLAKVAEAVKKSKSSG
jgi:large subunit ribosomal protein L21